mmetsp:Transcript_22785/g.27534  ORF Transcript_22785/g.27534 Transcript_22785/m.27534 type:complete len:303 (+) Transcript_22785:117-1025(+)|eukprot:CAMPEP_0197847406 /NCGR_PEP_ID=MMETSP1438-20131217/6025_1 /TAXON_ID=1461541 /ORGANISM="Pterosperma sp., Strain CCMP1384" /LENGTH=302 /DNA_ID=CAMNT_0043459319 /DNA_START=114 /DNA_END=1022 /DNA_ORIENTATION=+
MAALSAQTCPKLSLQRKGTTRSANNVHAVAPVAQKNLRSSAVHNSFTLRATKKHSAQSKAAASTGRKCSTIYAVASDVSTAPKVPPVPTPVDPNNPLIQAANKFIYSQSGFYSAPDEDIFAEDFVFRGPVIGPLNKKDYIFTMTTFGIYDAIPDFSPNAFGFTLDPQEPNRVWFTVRYSGTFTGEPGIGLGSGQFVPPNGATLEGAPEQYSVTFDENNKVKHLSVGYVVDRFQGNTKGFGAAFGIFKVIGLPLPAIGPQLRFAQWFSSVAFKGKSPMSYSAPEDVPAWWTAKSKAFGCDEPN